MQSFQVSTMAEKGKQPAGGGRVGSGRQLGQVASAGQVVGQPRAGGCLLASAVLQPRIAQAPVVGGKGDPGLGPGTCAQLIAVTPPGEDVGQFAGGGFVAPIGSGA